MPPAPQRFEEGPHPQTPESVVPTWHPRSGRFHHHALRPRQPKSELLRSHNHTRRVGHSLPSTLTAASCTREGKGDPLPIFDNAIK